MRFLLVLVRTLVDFIVAEWRWCEREPLLGGMVDMHVHIWSVGYRCQIRLCLESRVGLERA